jgi:hypothetical protein
MKIKISNQVLKQDFQKIINNGYYFEKGKVSGFSIEVFEPETESFSSYTYYDDEKNRDNDYEILCGLK